MTHFYVHFGSDGINTVIHKSARKHWKDKPGVLVHISDDDKQVVQESHPQDLIFTGKRIEAQTEAKPLQSAIIPVELPSGKSWLERLAWVAGGAAAAATLLNL